MPRISGIALLAGALICAVPAYAQQEWPSKPIRLVIPNTAGSSTDLVGRTFASYASRTFGHTWVVENRSGADGLIGAEAVARAAPDGYTLFFATTATLAIGPATRKSMPFDPVRDFVPIAVVADSTGGFVIVANSAAPFATLPEMIAHAKAHPGKLTYGTTVPFFEMFGEWLRKRAAIDLVQVPYKSTTQSLQDTVTGIVDMGLLGYVTVEPFVKAGKLRVLAVAAASRQEDLPNVAPVSETFADFNMDSWVTLVGPAGMPAEIVRQINREAAAVVKDPKFLQDLKRTRWANLRGARTPEGTGEFIREERERWARIIREIGREPR